MTMGLGPGVGEVNPAEAWEILKSDPKSVLVDVRTTAEWGFVGLPDLSGLGKSLVCVEWAQYPNMSKNPLFAEQVMNELGGEVPSCVLFICRSGARSMHAARAVAAELSAAGNSVQCLNVAEGFEGDLDEQKHRGAVNGWKTRGLSWRQS